MSTYLELDSIWRDRQIYPNPCDYQLTPEQVSTWTKSAREVRALPQSPGERPLDFVSSISAWNVALPYPRVELFANRFIEVSTITGGNTFTTTVDHGLSINDIVMTSSPGYSTSNGVQRNVEYHVIATPTTTTFQVSLTAGGAAAAFTNGTGLALIFAVLTAADYDDVITATDNALLLLTFPRIYLDVHSHRYNDLRMIKSPGAVLAEAKFVLVLDKIIFDDNLMPIWIHYRSHGEQVMRFKRDDPVHIKFITRDGSTIDFFTESDLAIATNPLKQTIITIMDTPYIRDAVYTHHSTDPIM